MMSGGMDELLGGSEELDVTSSCELIGRMPLVMISGGMDELLGVTEELLEGTYVSLDEWGMPEVRELDLGGTNEELDSMGGMSSPEVISRESIFTEEEDCSVTEELDSAPGSAIATRMPWILRVHTRFFDAIGRNAVGFACRKRNKCRNAEDCGKSGLCRRRPFAVLFNLAFLDVHNSLLLFR